jgi:hypothetical protein
MLQKSLLLSLAFLCACGEGPTAPTQYAAPTVDVRVHFRDPPAASGGEVVLRAYYITKVKSPLAPGRLSQTWAAGASSPFRADEVRFQLARSYAEAPADGDVRLFSLSASLPESQPQAMGGYWATPGLLLVYAAQPTPWSLFAPGSGTVNLPKGYSWLRRTCGASPGQIQLEVRPVDEVVEFVPVAGNPEADDGADAAEQAFVASCGVTAPIQDLGTRVSFDRAGELI